MMASKAAGANFPPSKARRVDVTVPDDRKLPAPACMRRWTTLYGAGREVGEVCQVGGQVIKRIVWNSTVGLLLTAVLAPLFASFLAAYGLYQITVAAWLELRSRF